MKRCILFDHDGVRMDTEYWYYRAGERALADIGLPLDRDQYVRDMSLGSSTWAQARAAGVDEQTIRAQREVRDTYYQEFLRSEAIDIDGVADAVAELSTLARLAIVTTAKRADFELIHEHRQITRLMEVVLVREDYRRAKPHPEPYLTGLERLGATPDESLVVEDSSRGLSSARGGRHRLRHRPPRVHEVPGLLPRQPPDQDAVRAEGHHPRREMRASRPRCGCPPRRAVAQGADMRS